MAKNTLYLIGILLTLSCLYSCKSKTKKWDNIANSMKKWENFELQIKGIKAPPTLWDVFQTPHQVPLSF